MPCSALLAALCLAMCGSSIDLVCHHTDYDDVKINVDSFSKSLDTMKAKGKISLVKCEATHSPKESEILSKCPILKNGSEKFDYIICSDATLRSFQENELFDETNVIVFGYPLSLEETEKNEKSGEMGGSEKDDGRYIIECLSDNLVLCKRSPQRKSPRKGVTPPQRPLTAGGYPMFRGEGGHPHSPRKPKERDEEDVKRWKEARKSLVLALESHNNSIVESLKQSKLEVRYSREGARQARLDLKRCNKELITLAKETFKAQTDASTPKYIFGHPYVPKLSGFGFHAMMDKKELHVKRSQAVKDKTVHTNIFGRHSDPPYWYRCQRTL